MAIRRVVTGTVDGVEVVVDDAPVEAINVGEGLSLASIWREDAVARVPNEGSTQAEIGLPDPGEVWVQVWTAPPNYRPGEGNRLAEFSTERPGLHRTDTVDVDVILQGRMTLEMEDGTTIELQEGDVVIVNGTLHSWRNDHDMPATVLSTVVGAIRKT